MICYSKEQPVSLRISVTDRCQLRCLYCMPPEGVPKRARQDILSFEEIVRFVRVVKLHFGLSKVHITGGEPLVRPGIVKLVEMLATEGIEDLALTTNGQCLGPIAQDLKLAGLTRVNISLDSLNDKTYALLTRGGNLKCALEGIQAALREGLSPIKLNTVVLRGYNDAEVTNMARWAIEHRCHIRFLELMPIGFAKGIFRDLFVPASEVQTHLEKPFVLRAMAYNLSQSSRDFLACDCHGGRGVIGFIAGHSRPFCHGCRRLRLTSTGQLIGCLARGQGSDTRSLLRCNAQHMDQALREIIKSGLASKRIRSEFDTTRTMASVGG